MFLGGVGTDVDDDDDDDNNDNDGEAANDELLLSDPQPKEVDGRVQGAPTDCEDIVARLDVEAGELSSAYGRRWLRKACGAASGGSGVRTFMMLRLVKSKLPAVYMLSVCVLGESIARLCGRLAASSHARGQWTVRIGI